jgi:hypothetical protein
MRVGLDYLYPIYETMLYDDFVCEGALTAALRARSGIAAGQQYRIFTGWMEWSLDTD